MKKTKREVSLIVNKTNIMVLNNKNSFPEEKLIEDLIFIIHLHPYRTDSLGKYGFRIKGDLDVNHL